jgi:hypothetical protein
MSYRSVLVVVVVLVSDAESGLGDKLSDSTFAMELLELSMLLSTLSVRSKAPKVVFPWSSGGAVPVEFAWSYSSVVVIFIIGSVASVASVDGSNGDDDKEAAST